MRTREENMAIAALVCAICGIVLCCGPASIVAIILGAMVVKKVMGGYKTMAMVGLIGGIAAVVVNILSYALWLIPLFIGMMEGI